MIASRAVPGPAQPTSKAGSSNSPTAAHRGRSHGGTSEDVGTLDFSQLYDEHADFVWRSIRRLGIGSAAEDVAQEVFMVVHRRLSEFEGRSTLRTWLFGIVLGVVRNHRRGEQRRRIDASERGAATLERLADRPDALPDRRAEQAQATEFLYALLDQLDDDKREVFVMAELEQMRGTEIAAATKVNLNTVYARLKAARREFDNAVARHRAQQQRRTP